MGHEQSKAAKRRYYLGAFHTRYFVGHGIDIGGRPDPLSAYACAFARMVSVRTWDQEEGDAQLMAGIRDDTFDFAHASHSLEDMHDVYEAFGNWIRIVKPGGYIVVTVPDEDMYEQGTWPSRYNKDHRWTFTIYKRTSWSPCSVNVLDLLTHFADLVDIEKVELIRDFHDPERSRAGIDQTTGPVAECAIEFVVRKRP